MRLLPRPVRFRPSGPVALSEALPTASTQSSARTARTSRGGAEKMLRKTRVSMAVPGTRAQAERGQSTATREGQTCSPLARTRTLGQICLTRPLDRAGPIAQGEILSPVDARYLKERAAFISRRSASLPGAGTSWREPAPAGTLFDRAGAAWPSREHGVGRVQQDCMHRHQDAAEVRNPSTAGCAPA